MVFAKWLEHWSEDQGGMGLIPGPRAYTWVAGSLSPWGHKREATDQCAPSHQSFSHSLSPSLLPFHSL